MGESVISTSLESARRLAITKQRLGGKPPTGSKKEAILSVVRDLCYVQWDPVSVVAPSHLIALWSRVGDFRPSDLDSLLWDEKKLFEHWTHAASIVTTEDYALHYSLMRKYPESLSKSWGGWRERAREWIPEHKELRKALLNELKSGPLRLDQFQGHGRTKSADGWTSRSDVSTMLFHMQMAGDVMIVGHDGNRNLWGLPEDFLPGWVERKELAEDEVEQEGAERTILALGVASPSEINRYFLRGRYLNLKRALGRLVEESKIHRVRVGEIGGRDERYVHDRDLRLLESMQSDEWQPRMTLLAPFDNLIELHERTKKLFGFDYVHENFLPREKRKFGTYVLPILWGDRFIGRIDPRMDRANETLVINSIHAERGTPSGREAAAKIGATIKQFADFLGAKDVEFPARVPDAWRGLLR